MVKATKSAGKNMDVIASRMESDKNLSSRKNSKTNYPYVSLDMTDLQIAQELLGNPLVKTSYIAHKLNQPLSTIQRRRRRLEDSSF